MEKVNQYTAQFDGREFITASKKKFTHVIVSANDDKTKPIAIKWCQSLNLANSYLGGLKNKINELRSRGIEVGERVHHIIEVERRNVS